MNESTETEQINYEEFRSNFSQILSKSPKDLIKDYHFIYLPGNKPPWYDSDIELEISDKITVISKGKVYLFEAFDIWVEPHHHLWYRIGETGEVFRGSRNTFTFIANNSGKLFLGNYPGDWADKSGKVNLADEKYYKRLKIKGGISILIIRWLEEPLNALKQILSIGDFQDLIKMEIDGLTNPIQTPDGWNYLWSVGNSEIFQPASDERQKKVIRCQTKGSVAILQKEALLPLKPDTKLRWSWKIETLPSEKAEDLLFNHDYLSIAVEFDNGQDITYHWSSKLPIETTYRCPIPMWTNRETHIVIRSGKTGLGQWINEERNVFEDYKKAIGEPPQNIIRVWLIALSLFQRRDGKCDFADIEVISGSNSIKIL